MFKPYQVVILDFTANNGHIWRHDFSSYGSAYNSQSKAEYFANTFRVLNRYVGNGINAPIKVLIFNTFKGEKLPREYRDLVPSDYY